MIYKLYLIGGPADGQSCMAVRPYFQLTFSNDQIYEAKCTPDGQPEQEWEEDGVNAIRLYFKGWEQLS